MIFLRVNCVRARWFFRVTPKSGDWKESVNKHRWPLKKYPGCDPTAVADGSWRPRKAWAPHSSDYWPPPPPFCHAYHSNHIFTKQSANRAQIFCTNYDCQFIRKRTIMHNRCWIRMPFSISVSTCLLYHKLLRHKVLAHFWTRNVLALTNTLMETLSVKTKDT